jgi:Ca2+-binding EF-hand superfamily protein
MSHRHCLLLALTTIALAIVPVAAQPPDGPGGFGAGGRPMNPVLRALDTDGNGEISAIELEKATESLRALDLNKDGKLSDDELRPPPPVGGPGPGGRGPGAGPGGGPAPSTEEVVNRYLSLDANKDGKLSKDEIPERMQGLLTRADADGDGIVTKDELTRMTERQTAVSNRGSASEPGRGPGGPAGRGGPPGFGPANPQAFVDRALEFDADQDGKLNKEELARLAEQMGPGRGGRGGPPDASQRP